MTSQMSPTQTVKAFLAAMAIKDYDGGLNLLSDDCVYDNLPPAVPSVRGPAGVRAVLEPFFAPTIENDLVVLREAAVGPLVFLERLDRHRLPDKWVELPVTGVFEVHDGKITLWRDYFDAETITSVWPTA